MGELGGEEEERVESWEGKRKREWGVREEERIGSKEGRVRESKGEEIEVGKRGEKRKKREKEEEGWLLHWRYAGSSVPSAVIEDKEIVYRDYVDISLAVATPKVCVLMCLCLSVCLSVCLMLRRERRLILW